MIVGFPGETEEEFEESKAFVDKVNFYETHIFKYSRRAGTVADKMPDQIPDEIKAKRSAELIELGKRKKKPMRRLLLAPLRGPDRGRNITGRRDDPGGTY